MPSQPITDVAGRLEFADRAGCQRWLNGLPVTNVADALQRLTTQTVLLARARLAAPERLRILETLGDTVVYVGSEAAKRFTSRPFPLEVSEALIWQCVVGLWLAMADNYRLCLDAAGRTDAPSATLLPSINLQATSFAARAAFEYFRIYRDVPPELWQRLHQLYALAESQHYTQRKVTMATEGGATTTTTCSATYARALLAQLANPFALSGRQLAFLHGWLDSWSELVTISTQPLPPSSVPPLAVDVAGDGPPMPADQITWGSGVRFLDLERLAPTLKNIILALKQGKSPSDLGLGADARQPGCESLVMLLYIQWCRSGTARLDDRPRSKHKLLVCIGLHAAHFHVSGRAFRQPGTSLSHEEQEDLRLFGQISERTQKLVASQESGAIETWTLVSQSASGFLCLVREAETQTKLAHNQIVALRRPAGSVFLVGTVQWLRCAVDGELRVGLRLFPGAPRALAARPTGPNVGVSARFDRALLLPEVSAPSTPATLLIPSGWYAPSRVIEIFTDCKQLVKLQSLLEKGADYDRCTVTVNG